MPSISDGSINGEASARNGGEGGTYYPSSKELDDRARVESRPGVTIKSWIELAYSLYSRWRVELEAHKLPECFVSYLKAYRIICEIIPNDPLWERFVTRSSDLYFKSKQLRMDIAGDFGDVKKVKAEIDRKHQDSIQPSTSANGFSKTDDLIPDLASRFEKLKARPVIARKPVGPRELATKNVFKGIPPPIPSSSTSVSPNLSSPNGSSSLRPNTVPSPIPSPSLHPNATSTPQFSRQRSSIPTSPPLMDIHNKLNNFVFPKTNVINAETLFGYLTKKDTRLDILIIDVRPREAFNEGHIFAPAVMCIEPVILRDRMNGDQLEESLFDLHPNEEEMFLKRHSYDLVVIHDDCSTSELGSPEHKLRQLREAIFDLASYRKDLRRSPVLLVGGLEAWVELLGTQSLRKTSTRSGSRMSVGSSRAKRSPSPNTEELIVRKIPRDNTIYMPPLQNGNVRQQHRQASIVASDPQFARTIQDFFQRYPSHGTQESMTSPPPTRYSSNTPTRSSSSITVIDHPFHGFSDTASIRSEESLVIRPGVARQTEQHVQKPTTSVAQYSDLRGEVARELSQYNGVPWVSAGTTGLKNLGNTCYMNGIIQCLSGTYPLSRHIKTGAYKRFVNSNNPLGYKGHLIDNYADLVTSMWSGQQTFISPEKFRALVGNLQPQFQDSSQQDAQEFLAFLLDGLHEEMNMAAARAPLRELTEEEERRRENMPIQKASQIEWSRYLHRNQTLVTECFQGQFRSRLRCLTCHFTSTTYNAFMYLSLPIHVYRNKPTCTLHECLDMFVQEEILEDDDSW